MIKRKTVIITVMMVFLISVLIGGSLASFNTQTDREGLMDIAAGRLSIDFIEQSATLREDIDVRLMPGKPLDLVYYVANSLSGGYDLYARVIIHKFWSDSDLDPTAIRIYVMDGDREIELIDGAVLNNGWILHHADAEQIILYYSQPLAVGASTSNLMDILKVAPTVSNDYQSAAITLSLTADAVQARVADQAIPARWGVHPIFDATGNIIAIEE